MASQATAGFQLKRLRGLLEKKGSDGTWRTQYFTAHKSKLYYVDPGADPASAPPRAAMDLLEGLQKIERRGEKLVLWVDAKRRHQLRAVANPRKQDGPQPSLDDWELSLRERRLVAKARRDEKARSPRRSSSERTPPTPQRRQPPTRQFSEAPPPRSPPPADRKPTPAEQAPWDAFVARQAAETPPSYVAADDAARGAPRGRRHERAASSYGSGAGAPPPPLDVAAAARRRRRAAPGSPKSVVAAAVARRERPRRVSGERRGAAVDAAARAGLASRGLPGDPARRFESEAARARAPGVAAGPAAAAGRDAALRRAAAADAAFVKVFLAGDLEQFVPVRDPLGIARVDVARSAYDVDDDDVDDDRAARAKIIAFYREHNPSKVQDVDALIAKYRDVGVGASELVIAVQKKYARDQPQRRATALL